MMNEKYLFVRYIILMKYEVVTRTFADQQRNFLLWKLYIIMTASGSTTRWRKISFLGKICKCRITRRILRHWKARDVRDTMVTKFLDSKKTDFWKNDKT